MSNFCWADIAECQRAQIYSEWITLHLWFFYPSSFGNVMCSQFFWRTHLTFCYVSMSLNFVTPHDSVKRFNLRVWWSYVSPYVCPIQECNRPNMFYIIDCIENHRQACVPEIFNNPGGVVTATLLLCMRTKKKVCASQMFDAKRLFPSECGCLRK